MFTATVRRTARTAAVAAVAALATAVPAHAGPSSAPVKYGQDIPWQQGDYFTPQYEVKGTVYSSDTPVFATDGTITDLRLRIQAIDSHQRYRILRVHPYNRAPGDYRILQASPWRSGSSQTPPAAYSAVIGWKVHRGERMMLQTDAKWGASVGVRYTGIGRFVFGSQISDLLTRDTPFTGNRDKESLLMQTTIAPTA